MSIQIAPVGTPWPTSENDPEWTTFPGTVEIPRTDMTPLTSEWTKRRPTPVGTTLCFPIRVNYINVSAMRLAFDPQLKRRVSRMHSMYHRRRK